MIKRLFLAAAISLAAFSAQAQQSVLQSGSVSAGHAPRWISSGVIGDGGAATSSFILEMGTYKNGGLPFCNTAAAVARTAFNIASTPYTQLCWGSTVGTSGTIYLNSYNGAAAASLFFNINGQNYAFPPSGSGTGNVVGPATSTVGNIALWNNTSGTLLADGGSGATFGGTVNIITASGAVTVTTAQKILIINKTVPAVTSVVLPASSNWASCPAANACPTYRIKDGAGNSTNFPIVVTTADAKNIDGVSSFVIQSNYGEIDFVLNGTQWNAM